MALLSIRRSSSTPSRQTSDTENLGVQSKAQAISPNSRFRSTRALRRSVRWPSSMARLQATVVAPAPPDEPITQTRFELATCATRVARTRSTALPRSASSTGQQTNCVQPARMAAMMALGLTSEPTPTMPQLGCKAAIWPTTSSGGSPSLSRLTATISTWPCRTQSRRSSQAWNSPRTCTLCSRSKGARKVGCRSVSVSYRQRRSESVMMGHRLRVA